jgi:GT2 family glycosyltransferase
LDARTEDLVDVINNAGTWIDPGTGECGDIGFGQVDRRQYNRPRPVDAICGVAMAVRSSVFQRLGGFDEGYTLYFEDTDFCARAAEQGLRAWYNPQVTIRHLHSATAREYSPSWRAHVAASGARFRQRFQDPRRFAAWVRHHPDQTMRSLRSSRPGPVPAHLFAGRALCR